MKGTLQRSFSGFPDGWPGFGLVLLRVLLGESVGRAILLSGADISAWYRFAIALILIVSSLAMVLGYLTPVVSLLHAVLLTANACVGAYPPLLWQPSTVAAADLAVVSAALLFIGPGAYSVDARLFGRREIVISSGVHPRKQ